jgi:hypothetical protein
MGTRSALAPIKDGNIHTLVDLANHPTTVYTGQGVLIGVICHTTTSAHLIEVKDGSDVIARLAVSLNIGDTIDLFEMEFTESIVIDGNAAATGTITLIYQPYPNS